MDRRTTIKWMLAASAAMPFASDRAQSGRVAGAAGVPGGYGTDPDLVKRYQRGDFWPLLLNPAQRRTATALCDVILPADDRSRSASGVGVVDFLDEWVSAPYPRQQQDHALVVEGLGWMDAEAARRFAKPFADLSQSQQHAICNDICLAEGATPPFVQAARFFARYRDLTAAGFYMTPEGSADIGYIGNVPRLTFDGPPIDVLRKLGLAPPV
jgi:Gluconate 2-dehydrogenase subunit 3